MSFKLINVSKFIITFLSVRKRDVMYADAAKHLGINIYCFGHPKRTTGQCSKKGLSHKTRFT